MHTGTPRLHTGIGPKQIAYRDSPFANGFCQHMVINIHASRMVNAAGSAMVRDNYHFTSMGLVGVINT
jgi:hypothetical protein